jgi:hypothetical protein
MMIYFFKRATAAAVRPRKKIKIFIVKNNKQI